MKITLKNLILNYNEKTALSYPMACLSLKIRYESNETGY
jgi:hypothetical protein